PETQHSSPTRRSSDLVTLRFPDIIEDRLDRINEAFERAIREAGYRARYQGVYPIKVNQRRVVVETIAEYGARYRTGLEAGSKAEDRKSTRLNSSHVKI